MKIHDQCLPCIVNQTIRMARMTQVKDRQGLYSEMFRLLAGTDLSLTSPEPLAGLFELVTRYSGCADPYREIRETCDRLAEDAMPALKERVSASPDPLQTALRLSAAGNLIDYSPSKGITAREILDALHKAADIPFARDDSGELIRRLSSARSLLLVGDNGGEVVMDRLLLETVRTLYPSIRLFYATRGGAVINDVTPEEAAEVGMNRIATLIHSGAAIPGTVLSACSAEFLDIWRESDLILAKGQGNYETLGEDRLGRDVFCLLLAKCPHIAESFGVTPYSPVCALID